MSDTPRTDSRLTAILDSDGFTHNGNCPQRWVNHARELERELNRMADRINKLEEAGDKAILNSYLPDRLAMWNKAETFFTLCLS